MVITPSLREESYPVNGSTIEQLRRVLGVLGPVRHGRRYAAYTDWEVAFRVCAPGGPALAAHTSVSVSAVVRLPCWRPPPSAPRELAARWESYVDALRRHEDGHVAIARAAGEAVAARLLALPAHAPPEVFQRAAAQAVAELRAVERTYDMDTRHGAAQGAVLFAQ